MVIFEYYMCVFWRMSVLCVVCVCVLCVRKCVNVFVSGVCLYVCSV